ncbi:MAG: tetratricopeptide repeat protein [Salinivirgaceae bacterium]|jgi:cytochrome c-type biogenesis protein CcmH/NrfG|nr:tetratricopeptide repeat protein [Salinivirgaceae bacterium]
MNDKVDKALELFRGYKLDESRELLEDLIKDDPYNIEALITLGKIHSRTQNYGEAVNFFNKVIEKQPNNLEAITGLKLIQNILQLTNNYYYENPYTDDDLYEFEP